jgi:hypothetical protein
MAAGSSKDLTSLVTGRAARSYLPRDGWWAEHLLNSFDGISAYGFSLAEVQFHHDGHYVRYRAPNYDLYVSHEPGTSLTGGLRRRGTSRYISIDELAGIAGSAVAEGQEIDIHDRAAVMAKLDRWADVLMSALPTLVPESEP